MTYWDHYWQWSNLICCYVYLSVRVMTTCLNVLCESPGIAMIYTSKRDFCQSLRSNFRTKVVAFTYITVFFSKSIDYWVFNWKLSIVVEYKLINVWLPLLGRFHFFSFERESSGILYKIPTSHVFWSAHVKNLWVRSERSIQLHVQIYPQLRILLSGRVLHKNGLDSFPVMFI